MQLNTEKKGIVAIFKPWQTALIKELFKRKLTSGAAHKFLEEKDIRATKKGHGTLSRASAIFFMNDMVDLGLLSYTTKTGKGGHHRIYEMVLTKEEFAHKIISLFVNSILKAFPKESPSYDWPRKQIPILQKLKSI